MTKSPKKKNPLYVVTNGGKDIEEADGLLNGLLKHLGLEDTLNIIMDVFRSLWDMMCRYGAVRDAKKLIDQWVEVLNKLIEPLAFLKF